MIQTQGSSSSNNVSPEMIDNTSPTMVQTQGTFSSNRVTAGVIDTTSPTTMQTQGTSSSGKVTPEVISATSPTVVEVHGNDASSSRNPQTAQGQANHQHVTSTLNMSIGYVNIRLHAPTLNYSYGGASAYCNVFTMILYS